MWNVHEFEGVELDDAFMAQHLCPSSSLASSGSEGTRTDVSKKKLLSICDEFVEAFLVERWNSLISLDSSIIQCMEVLNRVQTVLEDFMKQLESIQTEMGDVREALTRTTTRLLSNKVSEFVLWGAISQMLLPPEIVRLLTTASEERLGEQYKTGLHQLLRYLQYRRSTWDVSSVGTSPPIPSSPTDSFKRSQDEQALREVHVSFKQCKPYFELVRVLDNVTVLSCVRVKNFLSQQVKKLAVPNTNICIQQEHSLKEYTFYVYFLKYAPGLLRHTHSAAVEGEKQNTLIPYRIVRALYREFRSEYCSILSNVYLEKFKDYSFDCNALEYRYTAPRSVAVFSHGPMTASSSATQHHCVAPQLSDLVAAVTGVEMWSLGDRGDTLVNLLGAPLMPAIEKAQLRKHPYEETIRSVFRLLCDVVTHEYLFSFQLFCGDPSIFDDTFGPILNFIVHYLSEVVLKLSQGSVGRMTKERWGTSVNEHAKEDAYGLLIIIRMCHDFSHFMQQERHLSCLDGFFTAVLDIVWPAFYRTYEPQRIALRCVASTSLAASFVGPEFQTIQDKMRAVHPIIKSLVEYSSNLLSIALGAKNVSCSEAPEEFNALPGFASENPEGNSRSEGSEARRKVKDIQERACAILATEGLSNPGSPSCRNFRALFDSMILLREEALQRLEELASYLISRDKSSTPSDEQLLKSAFLLNNVHYMYTQISQSRVILGEEEYLLPEAQPHSNHQMQDSDSVVLVGALCPLKDLQERHESSQKRFISNIIQKCLPELSNLILSGDNATEDNTWEGKPSADAGAVFTAAQNFATHWTAMLNSVRDSVCHLIADPSHEKDVIAQACMECLLLNKRFHELVNNCFRNSPEQLRGKPPLHSLLISNQKLLVHMRFFSTISE